MRLMAVRGADPFLIAVGTVLSARTRDDTLGPFLERFFRLVRTPEDVLAMPRRRLERWLRPTGFYRTKARALHGLARALRERHGGRVPDTLDELLALPGVGIKVAAIILVEAFGKDAISVDTHVHRICNRMGLVRTRAPEQTSEALYCLLPRRLWRHVNVNLVALGQTICQPRRPHCEVCPAAGACPKIGVAGDGVMAATRPGPSRRRTARRVGAAARVPPRRGTTPHAPRASD
jgi:endonuclease-3